MSFKEYGITEFNGKPAFFDNQGNRLNKVYDIQAVKRKLAAFILQGQEACFIHHLTVLCSSNDIPIYKNEYDGLITGKKIPENLVKLAAVKAKMKSPKIEMKEICSDRKFDEMMAYLNINCF